MKRGGRRWPSRAISSLPHFPAPTFCSPGHSTSDELIDMLELTLRRVIELPTDISPPLVQAARPALAAVTRMRIAGRFATISDHITHNFRLGSHKPQSRSREQRISFARQPAMFLSRRISGAPFESIGAHFRRDHCTVIHAYRVIDRRIKRDAAFRLFIEKLEQRIDVSARLRGVL
jgi:chromosomal replication initiation ATPase DnaA